MSKYFESAIWHIAFTNVKYSMNVGRDYFYDTTRQFILTRRPKPVWPK